LCSPFDYRTLDGNDSTLTPLDILILTGTSSASEDGYWGLDMDYAVSFDAGDIDYNHLVSAAVPMDLVAPKGVGHPERQAILDRLASLPDDMPILMITPGSRAELDVADAYWRNHLRDGSAVQVEARDLIRRMSDYALDVYGQWTVPSLPK